MLPKTLPVKEEKKKDFENMYFCKVNIGPKTVLQLFKRKIRQFVKISAIRASEGITCS